MVEAEPQDRLREAERKQRLAADPGVSAWVRANAGTGKTHVLVQRLLRLLLSGAAPRSILCLTFTKSAAAEMEARVLSELAKWATADDETLAARLVKLLERSPGEAEMTASRRLFAAVIDGPGGLAIMTIHSFCERTLRRYSFEANVPPGFKVLTEEEARNALGEAMAQTFAAARSGDLRDALEVVVAHAGEAEFSRVLQAMLGRRNEIVHLLQVSGEEDPFGTIEARLRGLFEVPVDATRESLTFRAASVLDAPTLAEAIAAVSAGSKTDLQTMERLIAVRRAERPEEAFAPLKAAFMTKEGGARKSLMTAPVKKKAPALHDRLVAAQEVFLELDEQICGLKAVSASIALLRLAAAIFERYENEKRDRAAVDFDGLIEKTRSLLSREDAAEWVLYQLDARIDHILVDEAQDTSPGQWEIVERLTSDFFSGQGARSGIPTLFAVGDEKQSIYGFQGAAPELLASSGACYREKARAAGFAWRDVDLDLSFRTLAPVLGAVDAVTGALQSMQEGPPVRHIAYRADDGGLVALWEPERGEKEEKGSVWEPEPEGAPQAKPAEALAARIAAQIKHWLESGAGLPALGRPIEPGDILILLRKREPMARLLQAALKREGVPVSGADRVALLDELAVKDLLALASALLQSEDDLALAEALKSPLFGFSDGDLFELTFGRETSLWGSLGSAAAGACGGKYAAAAAIMAKWRECAHRLSPFDFYSRVLEAEGGRAAFGARLGEECFDALDELLNIAETLGPVALSEFLVFLRRGASDVKREADQAAREVRIMTVHGAKGLEANIVILADACSSRGASAPPVFLAGEEKEGPPIPVWAVKGASGLSPIADVKAKLSDAERREMSRLLYVAMTRARDCLYITGSHKGELTSRCWYETVKGALGPALEQAQDFQGRAVWQTGCVGQTKAFAWPARPAAGEAAPPWLGAPVSHELPVPILSPSQVAGGHDGLTVQPERAPWGRGKAKAMGNLVHRLLELLPAIEPACRTGAAGIIASTFLHELGERLSDVAIADVLGLLSAGGLDQGAARALTEAGVAAALRDDLGRCRGIVLGQADRISFLAREIIIQDYKSGALAEDSQTSSRFHAQLGAYRAALQRIYPALNVRAAVINTRSKAIAPAPDATLDTVWASFTGTLPE